MGLWVADTGDTYMHPSDPDRTYDHHCRYHRTALQNVCPLRRFQERVYTDTDCRLRRNGSPADKCHRTAEQFSLHTCHGGPGRTRNAPCYYYSKDHPTLYYNVVTCHRTSADRKRRRDRQGFYFQAARYMIR